MKDAKKLKNIIITSVLVIVFVLSAYKIVTKVSGDLKSEAVYSELRSNNKEEDGKCIKEDLSNINKDFVGWVTIDNTDLEYPFVQGEDNDHYLHRDINHNDSTAGTIFMDYRDNLDSSQNIILYGHHMKNGTMFTPVVKYKEEDFLGLEIKDAVNKVPVNKVITFFFILKLLIIELFVISIWE